MYLPRYESCYITKKHIYNLHDPFSNKYIFPLEIKSHYPKFLVAFISKVLLEDMLSKGRMQTLECEPELLLPTTLVYVTSLEKWIVLSIPSKPNSEYPYLHESFSSDSSLYWSLSSQTFYLACPQCILYPNIIVYLLFSRHCEKYITQIISFISHKKLWGRYLNRYCT